MATGTAICTAVSTDTEVTSDFLNALVLTYVKGISLKVLSQMTSLSTKQVIEYLQAQGINMNIPVVEYRVAIKGLSRINKYLELDDSTTNVAKLLNVHEEVVDWAVSWTNTKEGSGS